MKTVKLQHSLLGVKEFNEQHAKNIMSIDVKNRGGWELYSEPTKGVEKTTGADGSDNRSNKRKAKTTKK